MIKTEFATNVTLDVLYELTKMGFAFEVEDGEIARVSFPKEAE